MKYLDLTAFVKEGYLQEVNRQFFHPLGLALVVSVDDDNIVSLAGVWNSRDDSEGIYFSDEVLDAGKAKNLEMIKAERMKPRQDSLGYWIQPVQGSHVYNI